MLLISDLPEDSQIFQHVFPSINFFTYFAEQNDFLADKLEKIIDKFVKIGAVFTYQSDDSDEKSNNEVVYPYTLSATLKFDKSIDINDYSLDINVIFHDLLSKDHIYFKFAKFLHNLWIKNSSKFSSIKTFLDQHAHSGDLNYILIYFLIRIYMSGSATN